MMRVTATLSERTDHIKDRFRSRMVLMRNQLGMSQDDLGVQVGLRRYAVSSIESGERQPRLSEAVLIAEAFGVELADMLGDHEPVLVTETRIEFKPHAASSR